MAECVSMPVQFRVVLTVLKVSMPMNMGRVYPFRRRAGVRMVVSVAV
jgi:hypothetical protein